MSHLIEKPEEPAAALPTDHGSFKSLTVWQRAIEMGLAVYRFTSTFPASEQFGLTSQLRRAAVSVASNIAEGYGRASRGEYLQFLGHARGSNAEVETQLIFARKLGFGAKAELTRAEELAHEVGRLLTALMRSLRR
ncbi:MAG TPA: four helix bundle protein [Terracidiphilus sp.]|nr:four helix bundle protein [Terracidiphilus sp.]